MHLALPRTCASIQTMNKKVLVAEDDALLSSLLVKRLQEEGFDARAAFDGDAAIAQVKEWKPDLLLLDILMPNKNGYEVLEALRADEATKDTRVIVVSNLGTQEDIDKAKLLGVAEFITKAETTPGAIAARAQELLNT